MYLEKGIGLKRFKKWEKLPDISGTYDCVNDGDNEEYLGGFLYAYPKVDESVNEAVKKALISIDDINEIIYQVFGKGREEIQEYRLLFKNKINQVILVYMDTNGNVNDMYQADNFTMTPELFEKCRPVISFFKGIEEAIEGTRFLCEDIEELPLDYFS